MIVGVRKEGRGFAFVLRVNEMKEKGRFKDRT